MSSTYIMHVNNCFFEKNWWSILLVCFEDIYIPQSCEYKIRGKNNFIQWRHHSSLVKNVLTLQYKKWHILNYSLRLNLSFITFFLLVYKQVYWNNTIFQQLWMKAKYPIPFHICGHIYQVIASLKIKVCMTNSIA